MHFYNVLMGKPIDVLYFEILSASDKELSDNIMTHLKSKGATVVNNCTDEQIHQEAMVFNADEAERRFSELLANGYTCSSLEEALAGCAPIIGIIGKAYIVADNNERDDIMQEIKLACLKAIKSYDSAVAEGASFLPYMLKCINDVLAFFG